jgi:hypothetical protein
MAEGFATVQISSVVFGFQFREVVEDWFVDLYLE